MLPNKEQSHVLAAVNTSARLPNGVPKSALRIGRSKNRSVRRCIR